MENAHSELPTTVGSFFIRLLKKQLRKLKVPTVFQFPIDKYRVHKSFGLFYCFKKSSFSHHKKV